MPNPIQGLMAAAPGKPAPPVGDGIDDLINQRMQINQAVGGHPAPQPGAPPAVNPAWPGQPQGWHPPMALGRVPAPMTGLEQAQPVAPEMGFDELMRRAQAIPGGR